MYNNSFYVDLMSNASGFDNTQANFKNKIHFMKPLEGVWEVAIVEISYTKSWKNVRKPFNAKFQRTDEITKEIYVTPKADGYLPRNDSERKGIVRSGHYNDVHELCKEIAAEYNSLKIIDGPLNFHFDNISKKIFIECGLSSEQKFLLPHLPHQVSGILGFDAYMPYKAKLTNMMYEADRPADINTNFRTLMIYSDIVEPQHVGGAKAKLLQAVRVPEDSKYGDQVVINYSVPNYVPVLYNDFESIEINIRDDTNRTIPFMFGRTRIKIHFKPQNV